MGVFYIQPTRLEGFKSPQELYHSTWLLPEMRHHSQKAVVVGDIPDLELFARGQRNLKYRKLAESLCALGPKEVVIKSIPAMAYGFEGTPNLALRSIGLLEQRESVCIPEYFSPYRKILENTLTYEYNLSPNLFWSNHMTIQERTIFSFESFKNMSAHKQYVRVHCDGELPKRNQAIRPLCHTYITFDKISPTFVQDPCAYKFNLVGWSKKDYRDEDLTNTYRMPEGKTILLNGSQAHSHTLPVIPVELWGQISRSVLIVTFTKDLSKMSDIQRAVLDRNTKRQIKRLGHG